MTAAWRRTPLWLRLITAVLVLAFVGLTLTGLFGARLLRGYLVDRVDEQLEASGAARPHGGEPEAGAASTLPSQFHLTGVDADGTTLWHQAVGAHQLRARPAGRSRHEEARRGRKGRSPSTPIPARGSFRAVACRWRTVGTLVLAMSLGEVDATVDRLVHIDVLVGLAVLAAWRWPATRWCAPRCAPLGEIELTAAAIGRGDLARRVPDHHPATEMGRLSRALNAMLEQIERAFGARAASEARARRSEERMRQFVADASHELRTPLTSIRGFAELHRQGAVTDPAEVSDLLARIEDEATRWACWSTTCCCWPASTRSAPCSGAGRPDRRGLGGGRVGPGRRARSVDRGGGRGRRRHCPWSGDEPAAPGGRQPAGQRAGLLAPGIAGDGAAGPAARTTATSWPSRWSTGARA